jgi:uncharacterized membrane protein
MFVFRYILAALMVFIGVLHFVVPKGFERIVPAWLPMPRALVYVSGVCEILGGAGLLVPYAQSWAAWGLIALYVAVFPANVNQAIHRLPLGRAKVPTWALWARLPFQIVFIAWAYQYTRLPTT